jgi:hypothetical protein
LLKLLWTAQPLEFAGCGPSHWVHLAGSFRFLIHCSAIWLTTKALRDVSFYTWGFDFYFSET